MLRKSLLCLSVFLFSMSFALAQTAENAVLLQWKFKKGETLKFHQITDMNMGMKMPMGERKMKMKIDVTYFAKVTDVNGSGTATLALKVDHMKMNMNMGPGIPSMNFDSSKKEDLAKMKTNSKMAAFASMLKLSLTLKVAKSGKVQELKGLENASKSTGINKTTFEELFIGFPMGPISKGATWEQKLMKNMGSMPIEVKASYAFKGMETVDGKQCAKLTTTEKMKLDLSGNPMLKSFTIKVKKSEGSGTILFSVAKGKLVSKKSTMNMEMSMSGSAAGRSISMEYSIQAKNTLELLSK